MTEQWFAGLLELPNLRTPRCLGSTNAAEGTTVCWCFAGSPRGSVVHRTLVRRWICHMSSGGQKSLKVLCHDVRMSATWERWPTFPRFIGMISFPLSLGHRCFYLTVIVSRLKLYFFFFSFAIFLFYRFLNTFLKDVTEQYRPGHEGRCRSTMTACNDCRRQWVDSRPVVRLVEQVLLHEQEVCFPRRAATVEMGKPLRWSDLPNYENFQTQRKTGAKSSLESSASVILFVRWNRYHWQIYSTS